MMEGKPSTRRFWIVWPWIGGGLVAVPAGCLMAYLALLPFFLGLFFFLLVGLLTGAVMFRLGKRSAPAPRAILWLMGADVVILLWGTGLVVEYIGLPGDATRQIRESPLPERLTAEQRDELYDQTRRHVLSELSGRDCAGQPVDYLRAFPGYLKWAATDGTMNCPRVFHDSAHEVILPQRKAGWLIRVILSLGLLAFAVLSQLLPLAKPPESPDEEDEPPQPASADEAS